MQQRHWLIMLLTITTAQACDASSAPATAPPPLQMLISASGQVHLWPAPWPTLSPMHWDLPHWLNEGSRPIPPLIAIAVNTHYRLYPSHPLQVHPSPDSKGTWVIAALRNLRPHHPLPIRVAHRQNHRGIVVQPPTPHPALPPNCLALSTFIGPTLRDVTIAKPNCTTQAPSRKIAQPIAGFPSPPAPEACAPMRLFAPDAFLPTPPTSFAICPHPTVTVHPETLWSDVDKVLRTLDEQHQTTPVVALNNVNPNPPNLRSIALADLDLLFIKTLPNERK